MSLNTAFKANTVRIASLVELEKLNCIHSIARFIDFVFGYTMMAVKVCDYLYGIDRWMILIKDY